MGFRVFPPLIYRYSLVCLELTSSSSLDVTHQFYCILEGSSSARAICNTLDANLSGNIEPITHQTRHVRVRLKPCLGAEAKMEEVSSGSESDYSTSYADLSLKAHMAGKQLIT